MCCVIHFSGGMKGCPQSQNALKACWQGNLSAKQIRSTLWDICLVGEESTASEIKWRHWSTMQHFSHTRWHQHWSLSRGYCFESLKLGAMFWVLWHFRGRNYYFDHTFHPSMFSFQIPRWSTCSCHAKMMEHSVSCLRSCHLSLLYVCSETVTGRSGNVILIILFSEMMKYLQPVYMPFFALCEICQVSSFQDKSLEMYHLIFKVAHWDFHHTPLHRWR